MVVVTGRSVLTARPFWTKLQLGTPLVCFNGAAVGYPGQPPISEVALEVPEVHPLVAIGR